MKPENYRYFKEKFDEMRLAIEDLEADLNMLEQVIDSEEMEEAEEKK